ncbi:MAG: TRAP transporter small permease [Thermodesulfobacteriota bacterium]
MNRWQRFDNFISRLEQLMISVLLGVMILAAFLQIVLRNFFSTGLAWGDPLVRYLVIWVGFIGASLAVREGKHITIEIVAHWLPARANRYLRSVSHLFSALVCGLLSWAALKFVRVEALMGGPAIFGLPSWVPQIILPAAFGIMTLRFGAQFGIELFTDSSSGLKRYQNLKT